MKNFFKNLWEKTKTFMLVNLPDDKSKISAVSVHYSMFVFSVFCGVAAFLFSSSKLWLLGVFTLWLVGTLRLGRIAKIVDQELKNQYKNVAVLLGAKIAAEQKQSPTPPPPKTKTTKKILKG